MDKPKVPPKWYQFRFEKVRMPLAWLGGVFLFVSANISDNSFRLGIPFVALGMLLRVWATGYLPNKSKELATDGPFAHVRNPLYIGNFLIGLGVVLIVQNAVTAAIFLVGFAVLYHFTVRKEESKLRDRLGNAYLRYFQAVPRYLPRWHPYSGRANNPFQWRLLLKHRELETLLGILLLITGLYLWEEVILDREFFWKEKLAVAIGLALILGLVFERVFRAGDDSKTLPLVSV